MATYGCSNYTLKWVNILTMIMAIPILAVGIYLATETGSECYTFLQKPILVLGSAVLVISLIGCIGAHHCAAFLLWIYLFLMGILILILAAFTIFAFVVTADGGGATLAGYNFKEYTLGDYSGWLQSQINSTEAWGKIKSCMVDTNYCNHLNEDYETLELYNTAKLSPTESGCCRPPQGCGYTQTNFTTFIIPAVVPTTIPDCARWSNNITVMCYDCDTCKGGVAQYVRESWKTSSTILIVVVFIMSILYCIGCCARFNAKQQLEFEKLEKEQQTYNQSKNSYQGPVY